MLNQMGVPRIEVNHAGCEGINPYYVIDVLIEVGGPWRTHYSDVVGGLCSRIGDLNIDCPAGEQYPKRRKNPMRTN